MLTMIYILTAICIFALLPLTFISVLKYLCQWLDKLTKGKNIPYFVFGIIIICFVLLYVACFDSYSKYKDILFSSARIVYMDEKVSPGQVFHLVIRGKPYTEYSFSIETEDNYYSDQKETDSDGLVTFSYSTSVSSPEGKYPFFVTKEGKDVYLGNDENFSPSDDEVFEYLTII